MSSNHEACNNENEVSHTATGATADRVDGMRAPDADASRKIGIVVIGRNEGHRLSRSLASALNASPLTIYVDSGSTDGSVIRARNLGVPVVELCKSKNFSAARARNEGASALLRICPSLEFIQFVDGDCELQPGWIANAAALMFRSPAIGAVSGRRREVNGIASMYNRLCDWEWDVPLGSTDFIGGDALVRVPAFLASGGYDERFIAGEEIDLSIRLRARGWVLWRQEQEMTLHDAKILKFSQWWQRQKRGGYAFGILASEHGARSGVCGIASTLRCIAWGGVLPATVLFSAAFDPAALWVLLAYPINAAKIAIRHGGRSRSDWERGFLLSIGKVPEALGLIKFAVGRMLRLTPGLIEYKRQGYRAKA